MSDTEQKTANKTGASGAAWSDAEKIAYLIVLVENEGKVDTKIASAPIPAGRSTISCKKLLIRLKEKHKADIAAIKAGTPLPTSSATATGDGGETAASSEKPKTPRKRKVKVAQDVDANEADGEVKMDESPKKKPGRPKKESVPGEESPKKAAGGGRKKKEAAVVKEEEEIEDEMEV